MELLIQILIVLLFIALAAIVVRLREFQFDYSVVADFLLNKRERALEESAFLRVIDPLVQMWSAIAPRFGFAAHRARLRKLLVHAGNPGGHTAETFMGYCLAISTLLYLGTVGLFLVMNGELKLITAAFPAIIGYIVPVMNLKNEVERRRILVDRQIPYFLDLISLTMGAGSTFLQAVATITEGAAKGPLVEELDIMLHEVQAGNRLDEALEAMTRRNESEELALMVQAVRQGEELGTPLVDVLENQASMNRYRRTQRGEQTAAKLPNRMAVPTTFMMLAVLLILFGPIIVKAAKGDLM